MKKRLTYILVSGLILTSFLAGCNPAEESNKSSANLEKSIVSEITSEQDSITPTSTPISELSDIQSSQESKISTPAATSSPQSLSSSSITEIDLTNYSIKSNYSPRVNFGQKFEPKGNYIIHGAGQGELYGAWNSFDNYRKVLPENEPLLTMTYIGLFGGYESFTSRLIVHLESPEYQYILPQIGLMFCRNEDPSTAYDGKIATGEFDDDLYLFMIQMKRIGRPVFLRPGYNFNGEWNGYKAETYKAAFHKVHDAMVKAEANNVALLWDYAPAASDKDYMKYYPGDDVVDWWSLNIFNIIDVERANTIDFLESAKQHKKPVIVAETTAYQYGVEAFAWGNWFTPYFEFLKANPVIKASCYINWNWTKYPQWKNWGDCRIETNPELAVKYEKEMEDLIWLNDAESIEILKRIQ